jgi:TrmH family RNA methyltransferase
MERITSAQNPTLKLARKLSRSARDREKQGKIVLDGIRLVSDYLERFGLADASLVLNESALSKSDVIGLVAALSDDVRLLQVSDRIFQGVSSVDTPSGLIAIVDMPTVTDQQSKYSFWLALDGIQDPGNLGSILRSAASTNVTKVLLSESCADPWSPKCLRGGMGAQFALPVSKCADLKRAISGYNGTCIATSSHEGQSLVDTKLAAPLLLMMGGEGAGLGPELANLADFCVRIPLNNHMESLNVGAAVAMICYEQLRQSIS